MMDLLIQVLFTLGAYCFAVGSTLGLLRML